MPKKRIILAVLKLDALIYFFVVVVLFSVFFLWAHAGEILASLKLMGILPWTVRSGFFHNEEKPFATLSAVLLSCI